MHNRPSLVARATRFLSIATLATVATVTMNACAPAGARPGQRFPNATYARNEVPPGLYGNPEPYHGGFGLRGRPIYPTPAFGFGGGPAPRPYERESDWHERTEREWRSFRDAPPAREMSPTGQREVQRAERRAVERERERVFSTDGVPEVRRPPLFPESSP